MNNATEYLMQPPKAGKQEATIYLIRHGDTALNEIDSERVRGWSDVQLNMDGINAAHRITKFLMDKGVKNLYSSDLMRAVQTADMIGYALNLTPKYDPDLRPWDVGVLAGQALPKVLSQLQFYTESFPNEAVKGGESYQVFYDRAKKVIHNYIMKASQSNQVLAVVTHSLMLHVVDNIITNGSKPVTYKSRVHPGGIIKLTLADRIVLKEVY